jgi:hemoglobin/transferrin/lactoferrin receptor protein
MKKAIWLLFIGLCSVAYAQELRVYDAELRTPLEFVNIRSLASGLEAKFTTTNDQGLAEIGAFKGLKEIEISSLGYQSVITSYAQLKVAGFSLSLEASPLALDQVVVSATRWSQSSRELPYAISSLQARDVALQNPQTTADLLGSSGEVFIQKSQQGGGSPMIRGFATNRLLISVDGVRMNNAIFRSGNLQQVISLDPFAVERTELYFGPGSVIYGSDAIGGVMSFRTLSPELSSSEEVLIKGNALVRGSSANNERSAHFDVNVGWQRWAIRTSVSHFSFGDLRMGREGPEEYRRNWFVQRIDFVDQVVANDDPLVQRSTGYDQVNLMQKIRFKPSTAWDFEYAFHYSETSDYDRYDRLIRTRDGSPRVAQWHYGPQVWMMNKLEANYAKRTAFFDKATLRLAQQDFEESRNDRDFNDPILTNREEKVRALSANLDFIKRLNDRHKLFYGLEAVNNQVISEGNLLDISTGLEQDGADRYPQATWQSLAAYLNHEWEVSERFTSQLGLRYNQFVIDADFSNNLDFYPLPFSWAELNKGALTGSAGFVFRPNESWKWRLNLGTAFRAPNIDDIGKVFDSGDRVVVVPNADLNAEYAYNAELGVAHLVGDFMKLDFSAYLTYLDQAMVRRPFRLNGQDSLVYDGELSQVQAIQNAAQAYVGGIQAGLEIDLPRGFTASSRFNWQRGREEDNAGNIGPSRHAAPWFGISRISYRNKGLQLQFYAQYSGEVSFEDLNFEERDKPFIYATDSQGRPYSPAWYTLNFKASYQISEQWMISAGLENLNDQGYRPYSSGLVAPGRNFIMSIRNQF